MINFGVGSIIATPTHLADGTAIAVPTPVKLATLQEAGLDLSVDIKTLYGSGMYPVAVAQGKAKLELKAKYADVSAAVLGSLFFGQGATNAIKSLAIGVSGSVPASSAYTVTPTVPASGTWVADMGVYNATTGNQMTRVASSPSAGQYSVSAGVYTFASADASAAVIFDFEYSATSTTANLFTMNNRTMGFTPSFSLMFSTAYDGKTLTGKFYRGVSGKLALPMKNEDFTISDFEAQFFANNAGQVGWLCLH